MASSNVDHEGRRVLRFYDPAGERRTLRLGRMSELDAHAIKCKVESLAVNAKSPMPLEPQLTCRRRHEPFAIAIRPRGRERALPF